MLMPKRVKEGESEVVGVKSIRRLTNEVMNAWVESKMVEDIENEKDEAMDQNQNWAVGERIIGGKKKKSGIFHSS